MGNHGILLQYIVVLPIFYKQLIQISIGYTISERRRARGLKRGDASSQMYPIVVLLSELFLSIL